MSLISDIKKNIGLASTTIMQRAGMTDLTVDEAFQEEYDNYKLMEYNVYQLLKEADRLLGAIHTLSTAQKAMSATLAHLTHEPTYADRSDSNGCETEMNKTVREPLVRFTGYFEVVQKAAKERQHRLLKYDQQRQKVQRLMAKEDPDNDSVLQSAEQATYERHEQYDALNRTLIGDLQKFTQLCAPYLNPSLEALCQSEHRWTRQQYESLVNKNMPSHVDDVDTILDNIRKLSICSNAAAVC